ncbi:unnamed protein product, partial [Mesorhabditis spiculigera]
MSAAQLQEHLEAIRKDYLSSVNQLQHQKNELARMTEEVTMMRQHQAQYQEAVTELSRINEISQRLQKIIADYMPMLPQQQQMAVMQELMQVEKLRQMPQPQMNPLEQHLMAQMLMSQQAQAQAAQAAQLLGMGRGLMAQAQGASPRGAKPNGMPQGMPQMPQMPPGFQQLMMSQFGLPGMPQFAHPMLPGMPGLGAMAAPTSLNVQVSTPSRTQSTGSRTPLSSQPQTSPREMASLTPPKATLSAQPPSTRPSSLGAEATGRSPVVSPQSGDSAPSSAPLQIADSPQMKEVKAEELSVA